MVAKCTCKGARGIGNFYSLGTIHITRIPPRPFSEKEHGLLKTFADQAVIAIQNSRLFHETRESLERQTATAKILNVIASSPSDVQPVLDAIGSSSMPGKFLQIRTRGISCVATRSTC